MVDQYVLRGTVFIFAGGYGLLLAQGVLPRNPKDPIKMELWRRKFGGFFRIGGPLLIVLGVVQLVIGAIRE